MSNEHDMERVQPPKIKESQPQIVEHVVKTKAPLTHKLAALGLAGALAAGAVGVYKAYDWAKEFGATMEAGDRDGYSPIPGLGIVEDYFELEVEPVNVEELLLSEAESFGVSGMGVQPIEFTATQSVLGRDMPSMANRFFRNTGNFIPGINVNIPDGNWSTIAHAWADVSGYTFAVSPHDGYELSIQKHQINPGSEHGSEVPGDPDAIVDAYVINIDVTDVHLLDTLVQFPENIDDGRAGYAVLDSKTGDFVQVRDGSADDLSEIEESWRYLLSRGINVVDPLDTYQISHEGTNIAKEELVVGGHVGMVALAAACDLGDGLTKAFDGFIELQREEGVIEETARFVINVDVSEAMDNFKNSLLAPHRRNPDGSHGPVQPGTTLASSTTFTNNVENIPTHCSELSAQPEELKTLVDSATTAGNEAAVVALLARSAATEVSSVALTESVELDIIQLEPKRASRS